MKKIVALFLMLAVICQSAFTALASASVSPTITVGNAIVKSGNTVEIPIDISNNTGFADLSIEIEYDKNVMTLTKAVYNYSVGGLYTPAQSYNKFPYNMIITSIVNIGYNGTILMLTFEVSEEAESGAYPITVDYYKGPNGTYVDGENCNYDEYDNPVGFVYVDGSITVKNGAYIIAPTQWAAGESFEVTIGTMADTFDGKIITALYSSDDTLKTVAMYSPSEKLTIDLPQSVSGDYAKLMWWNNLSDMIPQCEFQITTLK